MTNHGVGTIGVWQHYSEPTADSVRELEQLGYGALWLGGSTPADWPGFDTLLSASDSITVATSILNLWVSPAKDAARTYHRLEERFPGRFLLGVGVGHREQDGVYAKPYDAMVAYLDELDEAGVPAERRALAALGPRVATLARERTAGALPYLTVPEHIASLRALLGPDALIATEHKVVLDADPERARETARGTVNFYLGLSNYVNNLRRFGFGEDELTAPAGDRLVDAVVAHGTPEQVADRLTAFLHAGADHVGIQVLGGDSLPALRTLAPLLAERSR
ncbi:LLM class F420-dependent oxidoreductase [Nocardia jejuensis]|uniref:LLM class F420-dependent oxidoreductase n=1 Tax=Nocardia jejuensis TaxID=328049 RepID=UPI00082C547C|nr:LLM class F420-dependent oxidoreductase [Nocardia jejuensis]